MKAQLPEAIRKDWRNIANRRPIVGSGYADQPYLLKTDDGAWLCCVTVSTGEEGDPDQHVQVSRSLDCGRTWSGPVRLEPPDGRENSYAVMLKNSFGRIYIFYNHNTDNVREILRHDRRGSFSRVDSLGHFVFRYSDDHGRTWSPGRYEIPVREFLCDRENVYGGKIRFFWNVGKPFFRNGTAYVTLHKVGQMGTGFYQQSEGVLLASANLDTETDPEKLVWETLPDGETGLRAPAGGGPIAEEQNCVVLSDGSICCSYRGIDGYGVEAYSRDGGHTFEPPHYKMHYDGTPLKNPRACNVVWPYAPGKYLYWFHNHGGPFIRKIMNNKDPDLPTPYSDRNPVWVCGGTEFRTANGLELRWGDPEILLYDPDPEVRISYPDFLADGGRFYISETEKTTAGIHEIPEAFLDGLFQPHTGTPLSHSEGDRIPVDSLLPDRILSFRFVLKKDEPGTWCRSVNSDGVGCEFGMDSERRLRLDWTGPQQTVRIRSERMKKGLHEAKFTLDPLAGIAMFYANGKFCDGGEEKQFGWQRFSRDMSRLFYLPEGAVNTSLVEKMEFYAG